MIHDVNNNLSYCSVCLPPSDDSKTFILLFTHSSIRIVLLHVDACCGWVLLYRQGPKGSKSLCMICFEGTAADSRVNV